MVTDFLANWTTVAAGFLLGGALAALYLGALWISVRRLPQTARPGAWLLLTGVIRLILIASAFAWMIAGNGYRLTGCLVGFLLVRSVAVGRFGANSKGAAKEKLRAH
jgi:F1F0 ATPase subunit 2